MLAWKATAVWALDTNSKTEDNGVIQESVGVEDATNKAIKFILASMLYKKEYVLDYDIKKYLYNDSYIKIYDLLTNSKKNNTETTLTLTGILDIFS